jgi:hypothetical protein
MQLVNAMRDCSSHALEPDLCVRVCMCAGSVTIDNHVVHQRKQLASMKYECKNHGVASDGAVLLFILFML